MSACLSENDLQLEVIERITSFTHDPLGHVLYTYPWGEKGTPLEKHTGPRTWQREVLEEVARKLKANAKANVSEVIQEATASGHGIGKSALVAWLVKWALDTFEDARCVITANTDTQLRTKTWPEVDKWHGLSINKDWFTLTATAMYSAQKGHDRTWRADIVPWSENNTEAFAGLHNQGKRLLLLFDEASAIADKIWEVAEGALTDENTEIIWAVFGNPTRNTGRFRDCFGRLAHRWNKRNIDARTVEGTNKAQLQKIVDDYGEDSDVARTRVRGLFPSASSLQFIETDVVQLAMRREPLVGIRDPLIMGVDVARGGDDRFVITFRRGMDGKSIPPVIIPGSEARDSMKLVAKVTDLATTTDPYRRPDGIIVDETGVGGPIVDRVRQILGDMAQVYGVNFASASPDPKLANMRAYMWWKMRDWLRLGGCLPAYPELEQDLTGPEYYHDKKDRVILESKEDMKDRGLQSPDIADGYAVTFAYPIQPREVTNVRGNAGKAQTDYDPYAG